MTATITKPKLPHLIIRVIRSKTLLSSSRLNSIQSAFILLPLLLLTLSLSSHARADETPATVTIETTQGAIFISGPKDKASAVRNDLSSLGAAQWPLEKIVDYITNKYPGQLDTQIFRNTDAATLEDADNLEMPLRRAILIGLLPPIEGLSETDALKVLQAAGVNAYLQPQWAAMDQRDRANALTSSAGQIAILKNTGTLETVRIILVNTAKTDKKDAPN